MNQPLTCLKSKSFFHAMFCLENSLSRENPGLLIADLINQNIRFKGTPSLSFPVSDMAGVTKTNNEFIRICQTFLGLYGVNGILPEFHTEKIQEQLKNKDSSYQDFLDVFNHPIAVLYYRAWRKKKVALFARQNVRDDFSRMLNGLSGRNATMSRANDYRWFFAGFFLQKTRSASNLQAMLSHYFSSEVIVTDRNGGWLYLDEDEYSRLSYSKQLNQLNKNLLLGRRQFSYSHLVTLYFKCHAYAEFEKMLPYGDRLISVFRLARDYLGADKKIQIILRIKSISLPKIELSKRSAVKLGWNTWLPSRMEQEKSVKFNSDKFYKRMECQ